MLLLQLLQLLFTVYTLMIFARIISSWFPEFSGHPILLFVAHYTDPYLNLFRGLIPPLGMLDLSPIAALFVLRILEMGLQVFILRTFL